MIRIQRQRSRLDQRGTLAATVCVPGASPHVSGGLVFPDTSHTNPKRSLRSPVTVKRENEGDSCMTKKARRGKAKPLSVSGVALKRLLAEGRDTQVALAAYLRCDQTTISKWLTNGATPTLVLAAALERRWSDIKAAGWLTLSHEPDAFCEPFAAVRGRALKAASEEIEESGRYSGGRSKTGVGTNVSAASAGGASRRSR